MTISMTNNTMSIYDQSAKADAGKLELALVPTGIIKAIAAVRMHGTYKYGDPDNWQRVSAERFRNAAYRHWLAYLEDPKGIDKESGLPNLWHCACNLAFLCEMDGVEEDVNAGWISVKDGLPEKNGTVIVVDKWGNMYVVEYYDGHFNASESGHEYAFDSVMFWRPAPKHPERREDGPRFEPTF